MPLDKQRLMRLGAQTLIQELEAELREARKLAGTSTEKKTPSAASRAQSLRMKRWWKKKRADAAKKADKK